MAEESMKDFEQEINESLENIKDYEDKDAGKWEVFEKQFADKEVLRVKITEIVKGGCVVLVDEIRAFIPASQLSTSYVEKLEDYQGKSLDVVIITVDRDKKKLVLSHRELEKEARDKERKEKAAALKVGDVVEGKVESIRDYGAFVDLGDGVSGLIHISQISHNRIKHPSAVLKEGDSVKCKVIANEGGKISLSKKALEEEVRQKEEKAGFDGFKYEEKSSVGMSLAGLFKNIKLD